MNSRNVSSAAILSFVLLVMLGAGAWRALSADLPGEKVLFEENFTEAPGKGWSWLRETPDHWKIDKERKELLISPVWSEGNMKNIPLRTAPDLKEGPIAIEAHVDHEPTGDYEFCGLVWYFDDHNWVTLRKGPHGEAFKTLWMMQRKGGKPDSHEPVIYNDPSVDLRMVVTAAKAQGWYRASSADKWQPLGEVEMPGSGAAQVGFRTGNGDGPKPSWARFSKFRILRLER